MAEIVYLLCAGTSILCALLLMRGYRASRTRLLFWSAFCFIGLAINNLLLLIDLLVFPDIDLFLARTFVALMAIGVLLIALIWERP
jgi:hypothetical protein